MQEHERRSDLCGVETGSGLFKLPGLLDVEHKITTVYELHHKEETVLQWSREKETTFPHDHPKGNNLTETPALLNGPRTHNCGHVEMAPRMIL